MPASVPSTMILHPPSQLSSSQSSMTPVEPEVLRVMSQDMPRRFSSDRRWGSRRFFSLSQLNPACYAWPLAAGNRDGARKG